MSDWTGKYDLSTTTTTESVISQAYFQAVRNCLENKTLMDWKISLKGYLLCFHLLAPFKVVIAFGKAIHNWPDSPLSHQKKSTLKGLLSCSDKRKAKHSCVMKFLLGESSQPSSSVVRASAQKAEGLGFNSQAEQTLFAYI